MPKDHAWASFSASRSNEGERGLAKELGFCGRRKTLFLSIVLDVVLVLMHKGKRNSLA